MLTIRDAQIATLGDLQRARAVALLLAELRALFAVDVAVMGEATARALVELAIDRALAHGFDSLGGTWRYLTLMVALGSYFDEDPQLPWVGAVLLPARDGPELRMARLYRAARAHMAAVSGTRGERYLRALFRARELRLESLAAWSRAPLPDAVDGLLQWLHAEKHASLGAEGVRALVARACELADAHAMSVDEGALLMATLMFLLGTSFTNDPVHRWAFEGDDGGGTPIERVEALMERARARLDCYLRRPERVARTTEA